MKTWTCKSSTVAAAVLSALVLCAPVVAAEHASRMELVGGAGYNTYSIDWDASLGGGHELFNSGFGASGGVRYWTTDSLGLYGGFDYLSGAGSVTQPGEDLDFDGFEDVGPYKHTLRMQSIGFVGGMVFRLPTPGGTILPFLTLGSYGATGTLSTEDRSSGLMIEGEMSLDRAVGYQAGIEVASTIGNGVKLAGSIAYRSLTFKSGSVTILGFSEPFESEIDASGMALRASIEVAFH